MSLWGTPAEYDYLLLCDGSQISAELYPELVKVLGGNTLPDLIGRFLEGAGSAGEYNEAGVPNIEGTFAHRSNGGVADMASASYSGAFSIVKNLPYGGGVNNAISQAGGTKFDASKSNPIYGSSNTVQPKSMTVKYYICYAG